MKILVTGGCGLLGRAIADACDDCHEIVAFDRSPEVLAAGGIQGEATRMEDMALAAAGCDAIIHTASLHGGHYTTSSPAEFLAANLGSANNVFQAALLHGISRVVVASSLEILVGFDWNASGMTVLDDRSPPRPDWIYPVTKLQIEVLGDFYARMHGLEVAQLRYVGIESKPVHAIGYDLLARAITPRDAATATLAAVHKPGLRNEVFLIGPDTPLNQADINDAVAGRTWQVLERHWPGCRSILSERLGTPAPDHFWPVTRIDKTVLMLGWKPRDTFSSLLHDLGWEAPEEIAMAETSQL